MHTGNSKNNAGQKLPTDNALSGRAYTQEKDVGAKCCCGGFITETGYCPIHMPLSVREGLDSEVGASPESILRLISLARTPSPTEGEVLCKHCGKPIRRLGESEELSMSEEDGRWIHGLGKLENCFYGCEVASILTGNYQHAEPSLESLESLLRIAESKLQSLQQENLELKKYAPRWQEQANGTTHWDGCWQDHRRCALALIESLQQEREWVSVEQEKPSEDEIVIVKEGEYVGVGWLIDGELDEAIRHPKLRPTHWMKEDGLAMLVSPAAPRVEDGNNG